MITIPGQLAIKTIHGRNGDFNVGRLATSIGEFVVKNAELDQYTEGKYEGDFIIAEIRPSTYNANGRMVIEIRAHLGGMTLSNIDALSRDDARRLSPQEVDPLDEETPAPAPAAPKAPARGKARKSRDPLSRVALAEVVLRIEPSVVQVMSARVRAQPLHVSTTSRSGGKAPLPEGG